MTIVLPMSKSYPHGRLTRSWAVAQPPSEAALGGPAGVQQKHPGSLATLEARDQVPDVSEL